VFFFGVIFRTVYSFSQRKNVLFFAFCGGLLSVLFSVLCHAEVDKKVALECFLSPIFSSNFFIYRFFLRCRLSFRLDWTLEQFASFFVPVRLPAFVHGFHHSDAELCEGARYTYAIIVVGECGPLQQLHCQHSFFYVCLRFLAGTFFPEFPLCLSRDACVLAKWKKNPTKKEDSQHRACLFFQKWTVRDKLLCI